MASKVNSSYYVGNVPVYAGNNGGAHTPNGCLFNLNIRVKPEVNNIGVMVIRTNDPLIHSYDNTTRSPEFELDLANINKIITLLKIRHNATPTREANEFIKVGVTTLVKFADKAKTAWVKAIGDITIFVIETNGQQEQFIIEGFFQNEYLLETMISIRDMFIQAKVAEECSSDIVAPSYAPPAGMPGAPTAPGMAPAGMPGAPAPMTAPTNYGLPAGAPPIPGA